MIKTVGAGANRTVLFAVANKRQDCKGLLAGPDSPAIGWAAISESPPHD